MKNSPSDPLAYSDYLSTAMLPDFKSKLLELGITPSHRLLLAISGGVDSVVLARLCQEAELDFSLAHANFQLRGEASQEDESFCRKLAGGMRKEIFVERFETESYRLDNKMSTQEAARELRYQWFRKLMATHGFHFLLTAHHADDNLETVLFHLFRGTGLKGMKGMDEKQGNILRPLLQFRKNQLLEYASNQQLEWREDHTNQEDHYSRNFLRNQVIPLLKEKFPQVEDNMLSTIAHLQQSQLVFQLALDKLKKRLLIQQGEEWMIPVLLLTKQPGYPTILFELVQPFGFRSRQLPDLLHLLDSQTGKWVQSATHRVLRNRAWLLISPLEVKEAGYILISEAGKPTHYPGGQLDWEYAEGEPGNDKHIACLDGDLVEFPLLLRPWQAGDYFYPLGLGKKKKLARFFIDQKLSKTEKERVWVLEMNKKIIWVVGHRPDHRFRVTDSTRRILKITAR